MLAMVCMLVVHHSRCSIIGAWSKIFLVTIHVHSIDDSTSRLFFRQHSTMKGRRTIACTVLAQASSHVLLFVRLSRKEYSLWRRTDEDAFCNTTVHFFPRSVATCEGIIVRVPSIGSERDRCHFFSTQNDGFPGPFPSNVLGSCKDESFRGPSNA